MGVISDGGSKVHPAWSGMVEMIEAMKDTVPAIQATVIIIT